MLVFEWINHFIFPIPKVLDSNEPINVQAFTASLPWTAYILVFLGWAVGAFEGGCTAAWLSQDSNESGTDASRPRGVVRAGERQFRVTTVLAILLVVAGVADMAMLGFPPTFTALGLLILAIFPYLGRYALNTFERKKRESMAAKELVSDSAKS